MTSKCVGLFTANGQPHWNPKDILINSKLSLKQFFRRSDHKSPSGTTRLARKYIYPSLSLDPDPSHAKRLTATASLLKQETGLSLSYTDNEFMLSWTDGFRQEFTETHKNKKQTSYYPLTFLH